jgi:predicted nucleic acid-binding protein
MRFDKIVVNASPIISLAKIGCADFLPALSSRFIIPDGVYQEITRHPFPDPATEWLKSQKSEIFVSVEVPTIISDWNLGKGETEVIAFALQNRDFTAVLDDRAAKNCTEVFNIDVCGTIGVIIKAKRLGLTLEIKSLLAALRSTGFRISEDILATALRVAGEG